MDLSTVNPWVGLGQIRFGEYRDAIRKLLGPTYKSFQKTPGSPLVDAYDGLGLHLYFDQQDRLNYIEAFPPSSPVYQGVSLLEGKPVYVAERLRSGGHEPRWDEDAYCFDDIGLQLYVPEDSLEAVGIFRKDLYY